MNAARRKRGDAVAGAILAACAAILLAADVHYLWKPAPEDVSGDVLIHLVFARNAAEGHYFQFNQGEFSRAGTSLLWEAALTAVGRVTGLISSESGFLNLARALAAGFLAMAALLIFRLCRRLGAEAFASGGIVALMCANPITFYWCISNPMETALAMALLSWLALLVQSYPPHEAPTNRTAALVAAVTILLLVTRPELVLLGFVAGGLPLLLRRDDAIRFTILFAIIIGVLITCLSAAFLSAGMSPFPSASIARRLSLRLTDASAMPVIGIPWSRDPWLLIALFLPLCAGVGFLKHRAVAIFAAISIILCGGFFSFYMFTTWQGRYLLPILFCAVPAGMAGWTAVARSTAGLAVGGAVYLVLISLLVMRPLAAFAQAPVARMHPPDSRRWFIPGAPDRTILVQEIQSAYFHPELRHISTEGLISLEAYHALLAGRTVKEFIAEERPDLLGPGTYFLPDPENASSQIRSAASERRDLDLGWMRLRYAGDLRGAGPVFRTTFP